jgi:hypothetical protein
MQVTRLDWNHTQLVQECCNNSKLAKTRKQRRRQCADEQGEISAQRAFLRKPTGCIDDHMTLEVTACGVYIAGGKMRGRLSGASIGYLTVQVNPLIHTHQEQGRLLVSYRSLSLTLCKCPEKLVSYGPLSLSSVVWVTLSLLFRDHHRARQRRGASARAVRWSEFTRSNVPSTTPSTTTK